MSKSVTKLKKRINLLIVLIVFIALLSVLGYDNTEKKNADNGIDLLSSPDKTDIDVLNTVNESIEKVDKPLEAQRNSKKIIMKKVDDSVLLAQ